MSAKIVPKLQLETLADIVQCVTVVLIVVPTVNICILIVHELHHQALYIHHSFPTKSSAKGMSIL